MNGQNAAVFDIGLVQAGAISAGAYTAGVIDFLVEALDAWEDAKARADAVPHHRVCLKVISGASAGAMTAAITAVALHSELEPVHLGAAPPRSDRNRLYDAWVKQIDISKLLSTADLDRGDAVVSLLNSQDLLEIARTALKTPPLRAPRTYVADPLVLLLTVANLRGVPYGFGLYERGKYRMRNHMDDMRFSITRAGCGAEEGTTCLDLRSLFQSRGQLDDAWDGFVQSALASGAFPMFLATRHLARPRSEYEPCRCELIQCRPEWDPGAPDPYDFLAVDGGLMNNEPLQLARAYLAGSPDARNERHGLRADRAIVLIDPFPNDERSQGTYREDERLVSIAAQMFSALKNQARFHALDMELIADPNVFSRFAISPVRRGADGGEAPGPAMCAGHLGGFGGFLKEKFRAHDFHLGRRNCQSFLLRHFCLPEENPLFEADREANRSVLDRYYVRDWQGNVAPRSVGEPGQNGASAGRDSNRDGPPRDGDEHCMLPIIPLVPPLDQELPPPIWPDGISEEEWRTLESFMAVRVKALGNRLIATELPRLWNGVARESRLAKAAHALEAVGAQVLWRALIGPWVAHRVTAAVRDHLPLVH